MDKLLVPLFEFNGIDIVHADLDETGRFIMSLDKSIEYYGKEHEEVIRYYYGLKEEGWFDD